MKVRQQAKCRLSALTTGMIITGLSSYKVDAGSLISNFARSWNSNNLSRHRCFRHLQSSRMGTPPKFPTMLVKIALNRSEHVMSFKQSLLREHSSSQPQSAVTVYSTIDDLIEKVQEAIPTAIISERDVSTDCIGENEDAQSQINDNMEEISAIVGKILQGASQEVKQTLSLAKLSVTTNDREAETYKSDRAAKTNETDRVAETGDVESSMDFNFTSDQTTGSLLHVAMKRAQRTLASIDRVNAAIIPTSPFQGTTRQYSTSPPPINTLSFTTDDVTKGYGTNPTISMIALAHSLWSHIVRPDIDTVIDATAGNGGDSVVLASLVFSSASLNHPSIVSGETTATPCYAQLVSIDIQSGACQNTTSKLIDMLPDPIFRQCVSVLHTSHAPLPIPRNTSSVALVVYNLGFLPQAVDKRQIMTKAETTIASMADAALLLRIGGMISAMTYPRTNREEAFAVRAFLEGLSLFSSDTISWETYILNLDIEACSVELQERLSVTLRYVYEEGGVGQVWRVHEHKKLGWIDAPILFTASRVK